MANEIKVTADTGQTITYVAYAPDGTARTPSVSASIPEIGVTGYYTQTDTSLVAGDTVKYFSSGIDVGGSEYKPETSVDNVDEIVDAVWDELLTGATHNIASSAGRRLRQVAAVAIRDDILPSQVGANASNQIKFDAGSSAVDGAYDPAMVAIISGDGIGQTRLIYEYNGTSQVGTVDRDWKVQPAAGDEFVIYAHPGRETVNEGLAQAGSLNTITLNALASSADDEYRNQFVFIRSGTGSDQVSRVRSYDGTTKIATMSEDWGTNPDNTSGYAMLPFACVETQAIGGTDLSDKVGGNIDTVFQNLGADTTVVIDDITAIQGSGFDTNTDSLEEISEKVDSIIATSGTPSLK